MPALILSSFRFAGNIIAESAITSCFPRAGYDTCHAVWPSTLPHVKNARPDIVADQAERKPSQSYFLQMASRMTTSVSKDALVEPTLGRSALEICGIVAKITGEFIYESKYCEFATRRWTRGATW